jgi:hypothetical protein
VQIKPPYRDRYEARLPELLVLALREKVVRATP